MMSVRALCDGTAGANAEGCTDRKGKTPAEQGRIR
jgi:hypothetical protein